MSQYSLDPIESNCYPDTTVLINKFGIRNENKLLQAEISITQEAAARWEIAISFLHLLIYILRQTTCIHFERATAEHIGCSWHNWLGTRDINSILRI